MRGGQEPCTVVNARPEGTIFTPARSAEDTTIMHPQMSLPRRLLSEAYRALELDGEHTAQRSMALTRVLEDEDENKTGIGGCPIMP
jgi:hypothetical protein